MTIACKCEKCSVIDFMKDQDDVKIEIDFQERTMTFVCRQIGCHHINVMDFGGWIKKQKHSPLPPTRIV